MPKPSPVIGIAAQDQAIAGIVAHLRTERDRMPMGYIKAVRSLMLTHGRPFYMNERSFVGRRGGKKKCYMNAYTLADPYNIEDMRKRFHLDPGCNPVYVEGWCYECHMVIEHAWCLDQNGRVIDPTLREGHASGYFGIPFQWDYVWRTASRTEGYGIISYKNPDLPTTPVEQFLLEKFLHNGPKG